MLKLEDFNLRVELAIHKLKQVRKSDWQICERNMSDFETGLMRSIEMKLSRLSKFMYGVGVVAFGCFALASLPVNKSATPLQKSSKLHSASVSSVIDYSALALVDTFKFGIGEGQFILNAGYAPDGKVLAVVLVQIEESETERTEIKLIDASTGKLLKAIKQVGFALSVQFSPDGKTIATGGANNAIRLWDTKTGKLKRILRGHSQAAISICFSPDGKTLASGSFDGSIKLWNVTTGELKATFKGHPTKVISVCYSPDGKTVASGSIDGTVKLWETKTGRLKATLADHEDAVLSVCFSPDGKMISSAGGAWSMRDDSVKQGNVAGSDNSIRLWDARTGKLLAALPSVDGVAVLHVGFSPDGKVVASLEGNGDGGFFKLWGVNSKAAVPTNLRANQSQCACFSPDGKTIAVGIGEGIQIWR